MRRDAPRPFALPQLFRGAVAQQQVRAGVALHAVQDEQFVDLIGLDYSGNESKVISVNAAGDGLELVTPSSITAGLTVTRTAGEALGGTRAVRVAADGKAYYANPDATARFTIGITTGAALIGAPLTIQVEGELEEVSWSWTDSEVVWLAANGTLTQTVPTTGTLLQVGIPMGPTKLRIEPQLMAKIS